MSTTAAALLCAAALCSALAALVGSVVAASLEVNAAVFNVRDFGATGDGVTKDTAAVQRAVDAASSAGGGEVLLPKGTYLCG